MRVVKITNPLYVAAIAPLVQKFVEKLDIPNLNFYSLMAAFQGTAQFGGEGSELWVAVDDKEEPQGFAKWQVMDMPFVGTVHWSYVYATQKGVNPLFVDEFIKFAEKHRAPYMMAEVINDKVAKVFTKIAEEKQLTMVHSGQIRLVCRR